MNRDARRDIYLRDQSLVKKMSVGDIRYVFNQLRLSCNPHPTDILWNGMTYASFCIHYIILTSGKAKARRNQNKRKQEKH